MPEDAQVETWYLVANSYYGKIKGLEVGVAFVDNDIYIQGLNTEYIPEAWVKGTLNDDNTATFAAGQYFGAFEFQGDEYPMYFVGSQDDESVSDVTFTVDMENGILSTEDNIFINATPDELGYYNYYYDVVITRDAPKLPEYGYLWNEHFQTSES